MEKAGKSKSSETKKLICNVFIKVFKKKKSLSKVTIADICKEANIARSTFYSYYNDVYDVMQNIQDDLLTEMENIDHRANNSNFKTFDPGFSIIGTVDTLRFMAENRDTFCALFDDENGDSLFRYKAMQHLQVHFQEMNQKKFGGGTDSDIFFEFIRGGIFICVCYWLNNRPDVTPEEMASSLVHILDGCLSHGYKID